MSPAADAEGSTPLSFTSVGAGPRVVLVHGFTQTGSSWRAVLGRLSATHEVVAVDLPGHGRSTSVVARDLEQAGALVANTGGRATYVGYSMGGRVALHSAFSHPEAVERLVLVGASPGISDTTERAARRASDDALAARLDGSAGEAMSLEAFLSEWLSGPLFSDLGADASDLASRRQNTTAGLASALRSLGTGTQRFDPERLGALEMPVLVVAGERDDKFVAIGGELALLIGGNARFTTMPGAGHAAPFEEPDGFAELVENWLCAIAD